jgi:hypothetical protein
MVGCGSTAKAAKQLAPERGQARPPTPILSTHPFLLHSNPLLRSALWTQWQHRHRRPTAHRQRPAPVARVGQAAAAGRATAVGGLARLARRPAARRAPAGNNSSTRLARTRATSGRRRRWEMSAKRLSTCVWPEDRGSLGGDGRFERCVHDAAMLSRPLRLLALSVAADVGFAAAQGQRVGQLGPESQAAAWTACVRRLCSAGPGPARALCRARPAGSARRHRRRRTDLAAGPL